MAREELKVAPKIPVDDLVEGVNVLQLHSMDGREGKDGMEMEMEDNRLHGHGHGHDHDHKQGDDETRKREDTGHMHHDHGHSSTHMDDHLDLDPSINIFFSMQDLKPGKTLPLYFPQQDPSSFPPLLSKEVADSIPFSYSQLPKLLEFFSFSQGSPQAKDMEATLRVCEVKPIKGETKLCATSQESMVEFVQTMFGVDSKYFRALPTSYLAKSTTSTLLQNYTILEVPKEIPAPKTISCHTMPYPYLIYYCHFLGGENKVFEALLEGQNGDRVDAFCVCHLDTSGLSPDNVLFRFLTIHHGASVCHFFPVGDLIWVPTPN